MQVQLHKISGATPPAAERGLSRIPAQGIFPGSPTHSGLRMSRSSALASLLNESSAPYRDPLVRLNWTASTGRVVAAAAGPVPARRRRIRAPASTAAAPGVQHEFAWRAEVGLWLESCSSSAGGRGDVTGDPALRCRFLHEIREQAGHSLMFMELFGRSGIRIPRPARLRPPLAHRDVAPPAHPAAPCSGPRWVIGEEFPDKLSRMVREGAGDATPSPLVHQVATIHTIAEARHIAHARAMCEETSRGLPAWRRRLLSPLLDRGMRQYAAHVF